MNSNKRNSLVRKGQNHLDLKYTKYCYLEIQSDTENENSTTTLVKKVVESLRSEGHEAKLLFLTPPVPLYQLSIDDAIPREKVPSIFVATHGVEFFEADIQVNLYGQSALIHVTFNCNQSLNSQEIGCYKLEIRNLNEFHNWYSLTFGEGRS